MEGYSKNKIDSNFFLINFLAVINLLIHFIREKNLPFTNIVCAFKSSALNDLSSLSMFEQKSYKNP